MYSTIFVTGQSDDYDVDDEGQSAWNLTLHNLNGCLPDVVNCDSAIFGARVIVECAAVFPPTQRGYLALFRSRVLVARTDSTSGALRLMREYAAPPAPPVGSPIPDAIDNVRCDLMDDNDRLLETKQVIVRYGCTPRWRSLDIRMSIESKTIRKYLYVL